MDDIQLKNLVMDTIRRDTRVDEKEISLQVQNGVVQLEGCVDSAAERRALYEDVEACSGVVGVVDRTCLRNYIERPDNELSESVKRNIITHLRLEANSVHVQAQGGKVILMGTVPTYQDKNNAENAAWWSPGVTDVSSLLTVDDELVLEEEV